MIKYSVDKSSKTVLFPFLNPCVSSVNISQRAQHATSPVSHLLSLWHSTTWMLFFPRMVHSAIPVSFLLPPDWAWGLPAKHTWWWWRGNPSNSSGDCYQKCQTNPLIPAHASKALTSGKGLSTLAFQIIALTKAINFSCWGGGVGLDGWVLQLSQTNENAALSRLL